MYAMLEQNGYIKFTSDLYFDAERKSVAKDKIIEKVVNPYRFALANTEARIQSGNWDNLDTFIGIKVQSKPQSSFLFREEHKKSHYLSATRYGEESLQKLAQYSMAVLN